MNRETKFRGKRVDNGEWVSGQGIVIIGDDYAAIPQTKDVTSADYQIKLCKVVPETVGEFAGLLDTNKKEIYEGDILSPFIESVGPYWVVFENGSFVCYHKHGRWGLLSRVFEADILSSYSAEVIGNIYENPDLLKKG